MSQSRILRERSSVSFLSEFLKDTVYGPLMEEKLKKINPKTLCDMALAFYSQMGWFRIIKMEWNEEKKEKTITLGHTAESEAFREYRGKMSATAPPASLRELYEGSFGIKLQGREVRCRSKGDEYCVFTITNKPE